MSNLSTLPKGDSAWLLRRAIERIMQQVSVLETNIGASTSGNSANTQVIFNDNGVLRGDADFTFNAALNKLVVNNIETAAGLLVGTSATITGDLTVKTNVLKVDTTNNRVGIGTATPATPLNIGTAVSRHFLANGQTTGSSYGEIATTGADVIYGAVDAAAGLFTNAIANASFFGSGNATSLQLVTNSTSRYEISSTGVATWSNVGGVAGTAMTLNSTGLGVGVVPQNNLHIKGASGTTSIRIEAITDGTLGFIAAASGVISGAPANNLAIRAENGLYLSGGGNATQFILNSSGNVGIGVTPSAWGATYRALQIGVGTSLTGVTNDVDVNLVNNARFDGTNWKYTNTSPAERYRTAAGTHFWYNAASGTAGNNITWTQAMTLDASGNLILLSSNTPATLTTNGQLTVNATSNTNLRFSYRGSDGVTRVANLTLA